MLLQTVEQWRQHHHDAAATSSITPPESAFKDQYGVEWEDDPLCPASTRAAVTRWNRLVFVIMEQVDLGLSPSGYYPTLSRLGGCAAIDWNVGDQFATTTRVRVTGLVPDTKAIPNIMAELQSYRQQYMATVYQLDIHPDTLQLTFEAHLYDISRQLPALLECLQLQRCSNTTYQITEDHRTTFAAEIDDVEEWDEEEWNEE